MAGLAVRESKTLAGQVERARAACTLADGVPGAVQARECGPRIAPWSDARMPGGIVASGV